MKCTMKCTIKYATSSYYIKLVIFFTNSMKQFVFIVYFLL